MISHVETIRYRSTKALAVMGQWVQSIMNGALGAINADIGAKTNHSRPGTNNFESET